MRNATRHWHQQWLLFCVLFSACAEVKPVKPVADSGTGADAGAPAVPDVRPAMPNTDAGGLPNPSPPACAPGVNEDRDQDGYSIAQGDCNDCDRQSNPGAFDVPSSKVDEDCNGTVDDEPADCGKDLPLDGDAVAAAKALGICRMARPDAAGKDRTWGLLSAAYVFPDGTTAALKPNLDRCGKGGEPPYPRSHGILPGFGANVKPREGANLVALSSGIARSGRQGPDMLTWPESAQTCTSSKLPPGFPPSSYSTCGDLEGNYPDTTPGQDAMALELVIRAPTNAAALTFDFDFYTYEYFHYVCSDFNDAFVALLYSKAPDVPPNHNIAFDSQKNVVSVNNGFLEACRPWTYRGFKAGVALERPFTCSLGTSELQGTGFDHFAATGWLRTRSNIVPGEEMTIRFAIWDGADEALDSTVLIDNFAWAATPGATVTDRPPPVQ